MCGILGFTRNNKLIAENAASSFRYRGPDFQGVFSDENVTLAHNRLSILDLASRSNQPLWNDNKDKAIVFNGEIYNYRALRDELRPVYDFRTESDTEVILAGYCVWGTNVFARLHGMFALAIYDKQKGDVIIARDHAGIKPLYWTDENGVLLFASELKGIASVLGQQGSELQWDEDAIALYGILGYIPTPKTLIKRVEKLPRGSWMSFDLQSRSFTKGTFTPKTDPIETIEELSSVVERSVLEHAEADVPVGVLFSGGTDSSVIASTLRAHNRDLKMFSVAIDGRDGDLPYIKEIAKRIGVTPHISRFGPEEFDVTFEKVLSRLDEPLADSSLYPTAFIADIASKEVKVVLSGEGGDELFLGYPRMNALKEMSTKKNDIMSVGDSSWLRTPSFPGKNRLFSNSSKLLGRPVDYYLAELSLLRTASSPAGWEKAKNIFIGSLPLWYDRDIYLENDLLRKLDISTSYASIEGRVPLLDARIWNIAEQFASRNLYDGSGKMVLKKMLLNSLPTDLVFRKKSGFGLAPQSLFEHSKFLRPAAIEAYETLKKNGVLPAIMPDVILEKRYPNYIFALIALHRAMENIRCIYRQARNQDVQ